MEDSQSSSDEGNLLENFVRSGDILKSGGGPSGQPSAPGRMGGMPGGRPGLNFFKKQQSGGHLGRHGPAGSLSHSAASNFKSLNLSKRGGLLDSKKKLQKSLKEKKLRHKLKKK